MSVLVGPRANIRVTCDASPSNDRSESALAANPLDPYNLVGSSKRFTNPQTYAFSLAAYATFDGGQSWLEAAPLGLLAGWDGVSDPAVAWDDVGNAYLVGLPFQGPEPMAIAVYKSTDHGVTWTGTGSGPVGTSLAPSSFAPQVVVAVDGTVYIFFMDFPNVSFVKSTDGGNSFAGPHTVATGITELP